MADNATKDDMKAMGKNLERKIDQAVTDLSEIIADFAEQVDVRFNALEAKVDGLDKKYERLLDTIDGFIARLDTHETEQAARDHQFEKLLIWARKVSEKTGIPLENL
jgi:hypothetical protein